MKIKNDRRQTMFKGAMLIAGILLFFSVFRNIDVDATFSLLASVGTLFFIILSFYFIGSIFDSTAWYLLLPSSPRSISFIRIALIHIAGESFYRFLPAGVVVGESVKVMLMRKHSSIAAPDIISSLLIRKILLGISQALYIGFAVFAGTILGSFGSETALMQWGIFISSVLLILFGVIGYFLVKGNCGKVTYSALMRIPWKSFRTKLERQKATFHDTDIAVRRTMMQHKKISILAAFIFVLGWCTELAETVFILWALGALIPFQNIMVFEPIVSFLRSVVFFIPAGLGIMDAGYSASLHAIGGGIPVTIATAFIIIKRVKELFWVIVGLCLTFFLGLDVFSVGNSSYRAGISTNIPLSKAQA